jgi:hypothetical protein
VCSAVALSLETYWHSLYGIDVSFPLPHFSLRDRLLLFGPTALMGAIPEISAADIQAFFAERGHAQATPRSQQARTVETATVETLHCSPCSGRQERTETRYSSNRHVIRKRSRRSDTPPGAVPARTARAVPLVTATRYRDGKLVAQAGATLLFTFTFIGGHLFV